MLGWKTGSKTKVGSRRLKQSDFRLKIRKKKKRRETVDSGLSIMARNYWEGEGGLIVDCESVTPPSTVTSDFHKFN
jgi:hypothetical protein